MNNIEELYQSLQRRRRPEDIAQLILDLESLEFSRSDRKVIERASKGSLVKNFFGFSSMSEDFKDAIGCAKQIRKTKEIFSLDHYDINPDTKNFTEISELIVEAGREINREKGANNFLSDRLNREQRGVCGLEISNRQYNKRFRLLKRLEKKSNRYQRELDKREFTFISNSRLATKIQEKDIIDDPASLAFVAYYTARCNLRSEFTVDGQQSPYDEISDLLFEKCRRGKETKWKAISYAYPDLEVLSRIDDKQKGLLLSEWFKILEKISNLLKEVWKSSEFDRRTMIVRRGNDSTTWNVTAGAWNKARDSWFKLLYAMGMDYVIDEMCPGKVLRLMAADVAAWHSSMGNTLEEDTEVWCALPLPWEVISGEAKCTKKFVEEVCAHCNVDSIKKGWVAPPPNKVVARYRPTPELVHGVTVGHPGLAMFFKKAGFFSGKKLKVGIE